MLHIPAYWCFDLSVTYPQGFHKVKFVIIPHVLYKINICEILSYNRQSLVLGYQLICVVRAAYRWRKNNCETGLIIPFHKYIIYRFLFKLVILLAYDQVPSGQVYSFVTQDTIARVYLVIYIYIHIYIYTYKLTTRYLFMFQVVFQTQVLDLR